MTDIKSLKEIFRKAWSKETSSDPEHWSSDNPAWGQCAVSACALQDIIGGEIVWAEVTMPDGQKLSHYFNKVGGQEIDFTREQFPDGAEIPSGQPKTKGYPTTRDYVLSFPASAARYKTLIKNLHTPKKEGPVLTPAP